MEADDYVPDGVKKGSPLSSFLSQFFCNYCNEKKVQFALWYCNCFLIKNFSVNYTIRNPIQNI